MKKVPVFLFVAVQISLVPYSCTVNDSPVEELSETVRVEEETDDIVLTQEEAVALSCSLGFAAKSHDEIINEVVSLISFLDENSPTTKSYPRTVESLSPILFSPSGTKAGGTDEDTLAFVVSFGNDAGFTVLSADRRVESVLVICPEGNLSNEFSDDNMPSIEDFYHGISRYVSVRIEEAKAKEDSLVAVAMAKLNASVSDSVVVLTKAKTKPARVEADYIYHSWRTIKQYGPYISVSWGQYEPYNNFTPVKDGKHCPTGCVATALAQIMQYWRFPENEYDWTELNKYAVKSDFIRSEYASNQVARLMRDIGSDVRMQYTSNGSSSTDNRARKSLKNEGYEVGKIKRYDLNKVVSCLSDRKPLYVSGSSDYALGLIPTEGHAWVLDGYLWQMRDVTVRIIEFDKRGRILAQYDSYCCEDQKLVHCNMGWDGYKDGWYADGIFDTVKGPEIPDNYSDSGEGWNFSGIRCIYNISR